MEELHVEGLASHDDPKSCAGTRKDDGEALTGAHAGWVLSAEIGLSGVPTPFSLVEGETLPCEIASVAATLRRRRPHACVEPLSTGTGRSSGCRRQMAVPAATGRPQP